MRTALLLLGLALVSCGGPKIDSHYPPRPENCDVKLFHDNGAVGMFYEGDIGREQCLVELKKQTCKLGGDIVYDVPDEPLKPAPDKLRYTGRVAHTRIPGAR